MHVFPNFSYLRELLLPDPAPDPESVISQRESISLAFMIALQYLPPRQRAVLLLRDVLNWKGREVADFLQMTELAASSALNRARKTLQQVREEHEHHPDKSSSPDLLARYVQAWHAANVDQLISLIKEDAQMTMPPLIAWYRGVDAIEQFLRISIFQGDARWQLRPVGFNNLPAFAMYRQGEPFCIQMMTIQATKIARIDNFFVANSMMALPAEANWFQYI